MPGWRQQGSVQSAWNCTRRSVLGTAGSKHLHTVHSILAATWQPTSQVSNIPRESQLNAYSSFFHPSLLRLNPSPHHTRNKKSGNSEIQKREAHSVPPPVFACQLERRYTALLQELSSVQEGKIGEVEEVFDFQRQKVEELVEGEEPSSHPC